MDFRVRVDFTRPLIGTVFEREFVSRPSAIVPMKGKHGWSETLSVHTHITHVEAEVKGSRNRRIGANANEIASSSTQKRNYAEGSR